MTAYDPDLGTSLPKFTIGQFAELIEDDLARTGVMRDEKLVQLPVSRTPAEYEAMAALAIFLRRLEPHRGDIAKLLEGRRR